MPAILYMFTCAFDVKIHLLYSREEDICPFGPLTQRLISALVEENIMTPVEDIISETNLKVTGDIPIVSR